jgi:hypothetical protein
MTSFSQIETNQRCAGSTGSKTEEDEQQSEGELVPGLVFLLWRLRGIITIETDLLNVQTDIVRDRREKVRAASRRSCRGRWSNSALAKPFASAAQQRCNQRAVLRCRR